jgi:Alpha/beta hydrolase family
LPSERWRAFARGSAPSIAPFAEMLVGRGCPPAGRSLARGVRPTLRVDVVSSDDYRPGSTRSPVLTGVLIWRKGDSPSSVERLLPLKPRMRWMTRALIDSRVRQHNGWIIREQGPRDARHAVLLLPGGLCSSVWYEDLLAEPALAEASLRFLATTLPGFAGTPPLGDATFESWVKHAAHLAADLSCDVIVGHSLGANVALEIVATKTFAGSVVLISPALSREDEAKFLRGLDGASVVFGHLPSR